MFDQDKQKAVEIYWLNKLSGELPQMSLPKFETDEAAGSGKTQLQFEIAEHIFEKLNNIAGDSDMAMFILFLSGLNIALHKYTGSDDILVGTVSPKKEGRKDNLVFCRGSIDTGSTFKETITRVKEAVLKDFDYVDYSFGILYQKLLANRDADSLDIFSLGFIYDRLQNKSKLLNQYDLVIILSNEDGKAALKVEYKSGLYTKEAVELFCKNLINLFDDISTKLDMKISVLDIVGPAWNYILIRGLYSSKNQTFLKIKFSPESAALLIIGICFIIETGQYFRIYEAHFDPYDYLAYISLILPCYLIDKLILRNKSIQDNTITQLH